MNMFKKFWQHSRTLVCAALFMICLISGFSTTASAESVTATSDFVALAYPQVWNGSSWVRSREWVSDTKQINLPRFGEFSTPVYSPNNYYNGVECGGWTFGLNEFTVYSPYEEGFYGDVGFYLNYYIKLLPDGSLPSGDFTTYDTPNYFSVIDTGGREIYSGETEVIFYDVDGGGSNCTKGVSYGIKFRVPEETPVLKIKFHGEGYGKVGWLPSNKDYDFYGQIDFYVPSASLILERTSSELVELENITDAILEQNKIQEEYYAEIISKVDDLYTQLGDLTEVQEKALEQFEDWNRVDSIPPSVSDKTDKADQVIEDINSLVKPDPEDIVPTIDTDTGDISSILQPFFSNVLIVQLCTMVLGFAFVSYVLFGKKG